MDELTLLRETRRPTEGPTDAALASARTALTQKWEPRRALPRRRVALLASAAAVIAVVAVVVGATGIAPGGASAQAADVLRAAALASIQAHDPVVAPGQYLEVTSEAVFPAFVYPEGADTSNIANEVVYLAPSHDDLYVPADRTQEWIWLRSSSKPTVFFGRGAEKEALENWSEDGAEAMAGEQLHATNGTFYGGTYLAEDITAMPRDPQKLYRYIEDTYQGGSNSRAENMWVRISDLLRSGIVPADLRAAMYRTLAMMPGVSVTADEANLDGRTGVAIGREEPGRGYRTDIIIDPATGQFIGEREVVTIEQKSVPVGTVWTSTAVETRVVDSAP